MSQPRVRIPYLPPRIEGLAALATNLWWSWTTDARSVFRSIDEPLWHLTKHNPLELLSRVDPARLAACATDPGFLALYDRVMDAASRALTSPNTWFRDRLSRPESPSRLLLRRVRAAQLGADLLRRPRHPRGRSPQGGI